MQQLTEVVGPRHSPIIGYAYVVADLIHVGHLNHLETCKSLCDVLLVGVLTDVATREKKANPTVPFADRLRMISALKCVNAAVAQGTYSPLPNALAMQADILFESTSHSVDEIAEARVALSGHGGKVIVLPYYCDLSTTAIKRSISSAPNL